MHSDPYLPTCLGFDALTELDQVDWATLSHAYGVGVVGDDLSGDVSRSLSLLREDPETAFAEGLWANVCHQGTVYEASAFALPFIAAVASGEVPDELRLWLIVLFTQIAVSGSYVAPDGSYEGSFGDGVADLIQKSVRQCDPYLARIEQVDSALAPLVAAARLVIDDPSDSNRQAALDLIDPAD